MSISHGHAILTAFATLFANATLIATPDVALAETYLIAIGNNRGFEGEPELRFAERDAQRFADVLRSFGRVRTENTDVLLGEDVAALRRVVLRTNVSIRNRPQDEPTLVLYYSGHADARGLHLGKSTMPFEELRAMVESSPARTRVLIVDSCRSGGITQRKGAATVPAFALPLGQPSSAEGLAIITSSAGSEDSQESLTLGGSFFTYHLVNALRGAADQDRDRRVTLHEAYTYAYTETIRSTGRTLELQHPTYLYDLKGQGDVVLTFLGPSDPKSEGLPAFGRLIMQDRGAYLIFDHHDEGKLIAEIWSEEPGVEYLIAPGRYLVRRRDARSYREYAAEVVGGQATDLGKLDFREITYDRLLRKGGGDRRSIHGFTVLAAARGPVVSGQPISPGAVVRYSLDFPWATFGAQARFGTSSWSANAGGISTTQRELGARVGVERFIDLQWFSFSLGVVAELTVVSQRYQTTGNATPRTNVGTAFGVIAAVERQLYGGLALRVEGGPMTHVFRSATVVDGRATSDRLSTPLTYWGAAGIGWRF